MRPETHAAITRPQIKPTIIAVPLPTRQFALLHGTKQAGASTIVDDPHGWGYAATQLLDGSRDVSQLRAELKTAGHVVDEVGLTALIEKLASQNVLADASMLNFPGLSDDQKERYSRNLHGFAAMSFDGRTAAELQRELGRGHVAIFGVGGLGSSVAVALAMAGCGRITIVDFDKVELSNLNRQQYTSLDLGRPKVEALKERLIAINPEIQVATIEERLKGPEHTLQLTREIRPQIAIATADRPTIAVDRWINDACFATGIPYVNTSVSAGTGMVFAKVPGSTGCFACDELWGLMERPTHHAVRRFREANDLIPKTSAFSFNAMAVGAMIASDVTRYLVRWPMASAGKLVVLDFATLRTEVTDKPFHPQCPVCRINRDLSVSIPAHVEVSAPFECVPAE